MNRDDLSFETGNIKKDKTYHCQKFKRIRSFGTEICNGTIKLNDAFEEQINQKYDNNKFKKSAKPKHLEKREKTRTFENINKLLEKNNKKSF